MPATCPLCGTYAAFWFDEPPTGCLRGNAPTHCKEALDDARAWAARRRVAPECYREDGKILDGAMLADVMKRALIRT